jgi:serine/threonine protein kinase
MSCNWPREKLWEWVHREADERSAADCAAHVQSCSACASAADEMRGLLGDLDSLADTPPAALSLPARIGNYEIVRKLGEGGMGVVFEARQPATNRRVALKVIRGGQIADDLSRRLFEREVQSLARLNHPGIASIYEAGQTADGLPYFAMELVDGAPLSSWIDNCAPDRREITRLLAHVCHAVAYAHQRGVIHRDLKPSNILIAHAATARSGVTADTFSRTATEGSGALTTNRERTPALDASAPRRQADAARLNATQAVAAPKILDFGLARIAAGDAAPADFSRSGVPVGTLPYMSPEQARGDSARIDVRTDVYALGAILYEALTGRLACDVVGRPLHEAVRSICETPPRAPRAIDPTIPADLSAIVQVALEKDPARRYDSAAALADDLDRFLSNHPIAARPAGPLYRFRKLVARHRVTSALLALIFLLTLAAAIGLGIQRNAARREAEKFRQINNVLTTMLQSSDPWQEGGRRETRVLDVLDSAAHRIETEVADELLAAALRHTLGNIYRSFSEYESAARHLRFAAETRERRLGAGHAETIAAINDLGEVLYESGDVDRAEPPLRRAFQLRQESLPRDHPDIAQSLNSLGLVQRRRGKVGEGLKILYQALQIRESHARRVETNPQNSRAERIAAFNALAQTLNNIAGVLRSMASETGGAEAVRAASYRGQAESHYRRALELRTTWLGPAHPESAKMRNNLARLLQDMDRLPEAEALLREALDSLLKEPGERHRFTALTLCNLADVLLAQSKLDEAREACDRAIAIQSEILPADHADRARSAALRDRIESRAASPTSQP